MEFKDYYKILGVSPDADDKAIKAAYRKLARKYHPDVSSEDEAQEKFKEVSEAYQVLRDPEKRAEYDQMRTMGARGGGGSGPPPGWEEFRHSAGDWSEEDFSDLFGSIFGGARRGGWRASSGAGMRGQDLEMDLPVFLEEAARGEEKQISYQVPRYDATGRRLDDTRKSVKVRIPDGTVDGERIRLKGQGAPAPGDGQAGDLYLRVRFAPHPLFDVDGRDLILTVPVAPWEAALGARVDVPTLDGDVRLTIPSSSQTGKRMRLRGKGLPGGRKPNGDLYAVLKVVMPERDNEEIRQLWKSLAEMADFDPRERWRR